MACFVDARLRGLQFQQGFFTFFSCPPTEDEMKVKEALQRADVMA
jgi:hypothetical protein